MSENAASIDKITTLATTIACIASLSLGLDIVLVYFIPAVVFTVCMAALDPEGVAADLGLRLRGTAWPIWTMKGLGVLFGSENINRAIKSPPIATMIAFIALLWLGLDRVLVYSIPAIVFTVCMAASDSEGEVSRLRGLAWPFWTVMGLGAILFGWFARRSG